AVPNVAVQHCPLVACSWTVTGVVSARRYVVPLSLTLADRGTTRCLEMLDGTDREEACEFRNVEALENTGLVLRCRVAGVVVGVPLLRILPGTTVHREGDRGVLIIPSEVAETLRLIPQL